MYPSGFARAWKSSHSSTEKLCSLDGRHPLGPASARGGGPAGRRGPVELTQSPQSPFEKGGLAPWPMTHPFSPLKNGRLQRGKVTSHEVRGNASFPPSPWIPAYAGMTGSCSRLSFPRRRESGPAYPNVLRSYEANNVPLPPFEKGGSGGGRGRGPHATTKLRAGPSASCLGDGPMPMGNC
jgi:hypothetical protein